MRRRVKKLCINHVIFIALTEKIKEEFNQAMIKFYLNAFINWIICILMLFFGVPHLGGPSFVVMMGWLVG